MGLRRIAQECRRDPTFGKNSARHDEQHKTVGRRISKPSGFGPSQKLILILAKSGRNELLMKANLQVLQFQSVQYLHGISPETLLPIDLAAHLLNKSPSTLRTDVTRRPQSLPIFVRFGRRVFFLKKDIDDFIQAGRQVRKEPTPEVKRRGRPTKAEQLRKGGAK